MPSTSRTCCSSRRSPRTWARPCTGPSCSARSRGCGASAPSRASVRDQPLARELPLRLGERAVAGGQEHVGLGELVVVQLLAVGGDELEHLTPELPDTVLVPRLHGRHCLVVELIEPPRVAVGQPELTLTGDPN